MKLFGLVRKRKNAGVDSAWKPISKEELKKRFCSPRTNDELLVVDEERQPVWYFRTYYYASAWEYYEVGRSVSVFADNEKKEIFREYAQNIGDYCYEDASFGKEADMMDQIEGLPKKMYAVSCDVFEDFVNRNQKIAWQHNGMELRAGDKIRINHYFGDDGAEYVDVAGHAATVSYRFKSNKPFMKFDQEIRNCRIFRDGIHKITICGSTMELPITDKCSIKKLLEGEDVCGYSVSGCTP